MERRAVLGRPTMRDISLREKRQLAEHRENSKSDSREIVKHEGTSALELWDDDVDDDEEELDPEVDRIFKERAGIKRICSNPDCLTARMSKKTLRRSMSRLLNIRKEGGAGN